MPLRFLFSLLACVLGSPLGAASLPDKAPKNLSVEEASKLLDQVEKELGNMQAQIEDAEPEIEEGVAEIRAGRYAGSSNPELSGSYGFLSRDLAGYHLLDKHASAIMGKFDLSILAHMPDGSSFNVNFGPVFSPGAFPQWAVDETEEVRRNNGTTSRAGTLMGLFKVNYTRQNFRVLAGAFSFQTSPITLSGRLSNRPVVFDKNPYMINTTSKAYYENQFLTGVPKRAPEESEHFLMGAKADWDLFWGLNLMGFTGMAEGHFEEDIMPREHGGVLTLDKKAAWGTKIKAVGFNRSNDLPEVSNQGGNANNAFYGIMNNTVLSGIVEQQVGRLALTGEYASGAFDTAGDIPLPPTGVTAVTTGGIHTKGDAWRFLGEMPAWDHVFRFGAYGMAPGYLMADTFGKYSNNGANWVRYRQDPDRPGQVIQQTNVADPTIPINNSTTYNVGSQLRIGSAFLNLTLQNSKQQAPSDSRIWSSHFLGGSNLNGAMWFTMFNNNYLGWLPLNARGPVANQPYSYGAPGMEREFFYNPRRDAPSPAFQNTTYPLDSYNRNYSLNTTAASTVPGFAVNNPAVPDQNNKLYYNTAYRELEAPLWRQNYEGILVVDPSTGRALAPSVKDISFVAADLRMNVLDLLPFLDFERPLYMQLYYDITTVNDSALFVPSLDPNNLFVQNVFDGTLVAPITDKFLVLFYAGIENWTSDRTKFRIPNNGFGRAQWTTLEYHDRAVGTGFDWNAIPSKLNLFARVKYLVHHDSFSAENGFIVRMLELEMKSYF